MQNDGINTKVEINKVKTKQKIKENKLKKIKESEEVENNLLC